MVPKTLTRVPHLAARLARDAAEVEAAQRLRFRVFVEEMGASGGAATRGGFEADRFDAPAEHLVLLDGDEVVGTARLLDRLGAARAGGFAAGAEFALDGLEASPLALLEVGRTCLARSHRGGAALGLLWSAIAGEALRRGSDVLFGLVSLPGADPAPWAGALRWLEAERPGPPALAPRSRAEVPLPAGPVDRRAALLALPPLARAYLRLGAWVGQGAFRDDAFGCLDVFMAVETAGVPAAARALYGGPR